MKIRHNDAKMEAGGMIRRFYITDEIREDYEKFDWNTYRCEMVESKTSQKYFVEHLEGLTAADRVELYINSMGGSVKEALGIYNVLRRCPATVIAHIDGFAASAASIIAMTADKVIMPHNTCMMIHNAAWMAYGNSTELRKSADDLEVINMAAIQSYATHAGDKLPQEELQRMLDAETWLSAEQCIQYGLADEFTEDVQPETVKANMQAARLAVAGRPEAMLLQSIPAALAMDDHEEKAPKPPEPVAQTEKDKTINHSSIYMLLKSMTKMEE